MKKTNQIERIADMVKSAITENTPGLQFLIMFHDDVSFSVRMNSCSVFVVKRLVHHLQEQIAQAEDAVLNADVLTE